jgi:hypothetical protein
MRVQLGLEDSITAAERAFLNLTHPAIENLVKKEIGYDPVQDVETEYYPLAEPDATHVHGVWDVNISHTRAQFERIGRGIRDELQLLRLPVRSISDLRVDENGRFGKGDNAFGSGTDWTEGEDFWATYEKDNLCLSGLLKAQGSWPVTAGSVKVTYRAGYSPDELRGVAEATATATDGTITTKRLDGSGLNRAVIITMVQAFQTWAQTKKSSRWGFRGPVISERAQDYSYQLASAGGGGGAGGLITSLPPEAAELCEPYRNWGLMGV